MRFPTESVADRDIWIFWRQARGLGTCGFRAVFEGARDTAGTRCGTTISIYLYLYLHIYIYILHYVCGTCIGAGRRWTGIRLLSNYWPPWVVCGGEEHGVNVVCVRCVSAESKEETQNDPLMPHLVRALEKENGGGAAMQRAPGFHSVCTLPV